MNEISVIELKSKIDNNIDFVLLDVREPFEYESGHLSDVHIPMGEVLPKIEELSQYKDDEVIVYCRSGKRSASVVHLLESNGFTNVKNLRGGVMAWKNDIDPSFSVG